MEPLKNNIDYQLIECYALELSRQLIAFDKTKFLALVFDQNWEQRELLSRIHRVAEAIHLVVGECEYDDVILAMEKSAPNLPLGFEQIIFPDYIKTYGLNHFERSMIGLERLTCFSTGEFAIRPFIKAYPKQTMQQMLSWSMYKNEHVRRLASEGCRPRLPWGGNLPQFISDPVLIIQLLENLKSDTSLYVRKSVANNLNDISKDHPDLILTIGKKWMQKNDVNTHWILKKAFRTLLKQSNPEALSLFGFAKINNIEFRAFNISSTAIQVGDDFEFSFQLINKTKKSQKLRVEYLIDFKKKTGWSKKVFHLSEFVIEHNVLKVFRKKHSFKNLTTRKHYVGGHSIGVRINGEMQQVLDFDLL